MAEMICLRRVHDVTLRDKVRSCEISRALNVEALLRIERSQLCCFGHVTRMTTKDWKGKSCWLNPQESCPEVVQGPGVNTSPTLLGPVLVWSQYNYLKLLLTVGYFESIQRCCPTTLPTGKADMKMNEYEYIRTMICLRFNSKSKDS